MKIYLTLDYGDKEIGSSTYNNYFRFHAKKEARETFISSPYLIFSHFDNKHYFGKLRIMNRKRLTKVLGAE